VGETYEQQEGAARHRPGWRRYARKLGVTKALTSKPGRSLNTARRYVTTSIARVAKPDVIRSVDTFCVLIGHVKSGGTLLGAILDAHPDAMFADEADALRYLEMGFGIDRIFHLLVRGSHHAAVTGRVTARRLEAYDFAIPGQWQGRSRTLRVIGDTRAGPTTRRLGSDPALLGRLDSELGRVRSMFVHVVREPFDPIAVTIVRGGRTFDNALADYAEQCERLERLRARIPAAHLHTVRYEDLVADPASQIRRACTFLGLEPEEGYVAACTAIVRPDVRPERERVEWPAEHVAAVRAVIDRVPFLEPYRDGA
jgi:hypothetical protein